MRKLPRKRIEECVPGDELDMGTFAGIDPREPGQGRNTVNVRLADGNHYTETAGALVRVHRTKRRIKVISIEELLDSDSLDGL